MSGSPHYPGDGDSLQTDVMRFMAIIAFCLIAILALVRDAEPVTQPVENPGPVAPPAPEATRTPMPDAAASGRQQVQDAPQSAVRPEDQGLSLRFASHRDFLNLVAQGDIALFAYRVDRVLGLDRNFEFHPAPAPGVVYELLPQTIPRPIVAALDRVVQDAASYSWGIRIPAAMGDEIRRLAARNIRGELVIDRRGRVHHVAG